MAVSPDNRWLIIGSPLASNVPSNYKGVFNPSATYLTDDIVIYAGKLWKAVNTVTGDGSSINVLSSDWAPATSIPTSSSGVGLGYTNQGMITVYEWANQQWTNRYSFVSPRPEIDESFGTEIAIGQDGNLYYMAVQPYIHYY